MAVVPHNCHTNDYHALYANKAQRWPNVYEPGDRKRMAYVSCEMDNKMMQPQLFSDHSDDSLSGVNIPGLHYIADFLSSDEALETYRWVDSLPADEWQTELSRRVIHYGWRYNYRTQTIHEDLYLGPLPTRLLKLAKRLYLHTELFEHQPNQVIINEYHPGQGIAPHADHHAFGSVVATISLGDNWSIEFSNTNSHIKITKLLAIGSALILTGDARYNWLHTIKKQKKEADGRVRTKRISLTFRTIDIQSHHTVRI